MADRSIVTRIRAEASQFLSTMKQVESSAKDVGKSAEAGAKQADGAFSKLSSSVKNNADDWNRVGNASLVAGGAIAAGLGYGVKAFADFDQAMSSVKAALPDAAGQMDKLRDAAVKMGGETAFSATEAAQGITELAKAGVSAEAILGGGLQGALDLAAAGQLEVGEAAEIAASAMTQFSLSGAQVPHIADLLAAGAGKAQGSVRDLGMALGQVGLVADSTGLSIEETVGGLAAFAAAGLVGSDAGTSFKSMLQRLTPQSAEAEAKMRELGISAYDAGGNFIGLSAFAGNLQDSLRGMSDEQRNAAMATIFGSDAVRAANILYKEGAAGIAGWVDAVNSTGYAALQAATLTNNLKGDIERLGGAIESTFIANGQAANDALRSLVQTAVGAVEAFGSLPGPLQQGVFGLAALTAGGLLAFGMFAKLVTTGVELSSSMSALAESSPRAAAGLSKVAAAAQSAAILAGVAIAVDQINDAIARNAVSTVEIEKMSAALTGLAENAETIPDFGELFESQNALPPFRKEIETTDDALAAFAEQAELAFAGGWTDRLERFLGNGSMEKFAEQAGQIDAALAAMVEGGSAEAAAVAFERLTEAAVAQGVPLEDLVQLFPEYGAATAIGADATASWAEQATAAGEAASATAEEIQSLAQAILDQYNAAISASDANIALESAYVDLSAAAAENAGAVTEGGAAFDLATEKGRNAQSALNDYAGQALATAEANLTNGASIEEVGGQLDDSRGKFVAAATGMGMTEEAANALADQFGLTSGTAVSLKDKIGQIPSEKTMKFTAIDNASNTISYIKRGIDGLQDKTVTVRVVQQGSTGGGLTQADGGMLARTAGGLVQAFASGGTFATAQPQIRPYGGPGGVLWGEQGSGPWEAFISGHPAKKARSRAIADQTVARLGGEVNWRRFADGGVYSRTAVAHSPSPAPSTGGTMRIEGVLDTPFGPSQVRGVVRSELDTVGRSLGGI